MMYREIQRVGTRMFSKYLRYICRRRKKENRETIQLYILPSITLQEIESKSKLKVKFWCMAYYKIRGAWASSYFSVESCRSGMERESIKNSKKGENENCSYMYVPYIVSQYIKVSLYRRIVYFFVAA